MRTSLSVSSMSICGQPSPSRVREPNPNGSRSKSAKYVVEHAIHFAVQRKEWMYVACAVEANLASFVVPGNEILDSHGVFSFDKRPPPRTDRRESQLADMKVRCGQAAVLPSICRTFEAAEPAMEIRRGFMASGSSRTSSIKSKPLSNAARLTCT